MIIDGIRISGLPTAALTDWPFDVAAIRHLADEGIQFSSDIAFLVGENGSGKSTIVEAVAEAYGADVRGGHIGRQYDNRPPKGPLGSLLQLSFSLGGGAMRRQPKGFFLRAETAFGVLGFMSDHAVAGYGDDHLLRVSHGESFLQCSATSSTRPGCTS